MARRKKVEEPVNDIIPADEALREEMQEVEDKKASEFLEEEVKDGAVVEEPKEEEPKKEELPKEEPKKEEEVEIDPDKMKEEIAEKVSERVSKEALDKISKALTGEKPTEQQKDRYQQIAEEFFEKNKRNPSWFELIPFIKEDLKVEMQKEQEAAKAKAEEDKKAFEQNQKKQIEEFNKFVTNELVELESEGRLPKMEKENKNDRGFLARQALIKTGAEVNERLRAEGKPLITSIYKIFHKYNKEFTTNYQNMLGPAGADAPVSIGRGSVSVGNDDDYSYNDIRNNSFLDILRG